MIDLEWVRRLVELVSESDIDSLEISRLGTRVRISKSPAVHFAQGMLPSMVSAGSSALAHTSDPADPSTSQAAAVTEEQAVEGTNLLEVTSPMVGTFYRAPAPDAPPYVETGDRVARGQTLCILEAMKLMNELEADVAGTIREICVENAEPVEYGQVLFRIDPD